MELKSTNWQKKIGKKIEELSRNYFNNWDWNYGKSPKFELVRRQRFSIGSVEFKMNVDKGLIQDIRIFGDFFGLGDISDVEERLNGIKYDVTSISEALDDINIKNYFGNITKEELIHLIY